MRELTENEVLAVAKAIAFDPILTRYGRADYVRFANAILAKSGSPPDERAILERERKAWDAAIDWCAKDASNGDRRVTSPTYHVWERDRRYPLPSPDPTPQPVEERVAYLEQRLAQLLDAHQHHRRTA